MLNIKNEVLVRVYLIAFAMLFAALLIFGKLWKLAIVDSARWQAKSDSLFVKFVDVRADRGNILADDGSLLATSLPFFDVHFDIKAEGLTNEVFDQNIDSLAYLLSTFVDAQYTPGAYRDWLRQLRYGPDTIRGIRYIPITKNAPYNKMLLIKNFPIFRLGRYRGGLIIEQQSRRERPFKILAQRTIGYVRDSALPVGLEGTYDKVLGGSLGKQLMIRVPGDVYIPVNDLAEIEPRSGDDLVTTIDINLQDAAETALIKACERHNADHGCAIVMEVKTGAVRAIANIGRADGGKGWWETFNYAVGERVEPGSMFKLASFMALLEDGYISDFNQKIPVFGGKAQFYNEELVDAVPHGMDSMTIKQIFAFSSNVGTASLVQQFYKNNPAAFIERLKSFGLGDSTGIEVGGEERPYIKTPGDSRSEWSGTTLPWMSIGYELMVTPLQLLTFFNAVANEGRVMKPYLVQRVESYGEVVREFRPKSTRKSIASRQTLAKAKELLEAVVESGTADNIRSPYYRIAGKTGTAQLNYHKFRTTSGIRHQAGFAGFFPADNPQYSCIVVISEPQQGGYHGSEVAAPVFREIADRAFAIKPALHPPFNTGAKPRLSGRQLPTYDAGKKTDMQSAFRWLKLDWFESASQTSKEDTDPDWVYARPQGDSLWLQVRTIPDKTVPSVVGMGLKDALYLLENRGCKVKVQGVGKVRRQSIPPGTRANGQKITLFLD